MLHFKFLASVVPLAVAAVFARSEFLPGPRPCIEVGGAAVQIAAAPWQAQVHVSFTNDPKLATVRVQISDSAEAADFTVIDDIDDAEAGACEGNAVPTTGGDLAKSVAVRSSYLFVAGRPVRLPDLRAVTRPFRPATPQP